MWDLIPLKITYYEALGFLAPFKDISFATLCIHRLWFLRSLLYVEDFARGLVD